MPLSEILYIIFGNSDVLTGMQKVFTTTAAIVGILAANRWRKELLGRAKHTAAEKAIIGTSTVRNIIAVARRSYRMVFFLEDRSVLDDVQKVDQLKKLVESERTYWSAHSNDFETAVLNMRNDSIAAEIYYGSPYSTKLDAFKKDIDKWAKAVSDRIDGLTLFRETLQPNYLNDTWDPILVSSLHYRKEIFDNSRIDEFISISKDFDEALEKHVEEIKDLVLKDFVRARTSPPRLADTRR